MFRARHSSTSQKIKPTKGLSEYIPTCLQSNNQWLDAGSIALVLPTVNCQEVSLKSIRLIYPQEGVLKVLNRKMSKPRLFQTEFTPQVQYASPNRSHNKYPLVHRMVITSNPLFEHTKY
jgi:hypothetical protein